MAIPTNSSRPSNKLPGRDLDGSGSSRGLLAGRHIRNENVERARPLTLRQNAVLRGIMDGLANKEIAWRLKTSETSVKSVIQELFHKAGVRTRSQHGETCHQRSTRLTGSVPPAGEDIL